MKRFKPHKPAAGKHIAPRETAGETPPQQQTPVFCLHYLQGDYCISHCSDEQKAAFADRLHRLCKLTWGEIALAPRHGLGTEKIRQSSLRAPLPAHVTEEVTILALRFWGKAPMVGYRDGRIFHVLYLDRDFTLYQH